ncbi:MAG: hypothetical protein JNK60_17710 [Acidobacteria bacterium]|nr:hypothetical protein [Acidobacteriota bacterium]
MNADSDDPRPFVWKPLPLVGGLLAALLLAVLVFLAAERYFLGRADAEVPPGQPTLTELGASLRPMARNAATRRFEELGAAVGIDLVPKTETGVRPSAELKQRFDIFKKGALKEWLDELQARADDVEVEAPAAVQSFLAEHHEELALLAAHLREQGSSLEWDLDPKNLFESPLPNLLGILDTAKLLEAAALEADRRGRGTEAHDFLDASFRLAESLERRPEVVTFLIAQALEGMHHVQVRRLRHPEEFAERLGRQDLLPAFSRTMRFEAFGLRSSKLSSAPAGGWMKAYQDLQLRDTVSRMDRLALASANLSWDDAQGDRLDAQWKNRAPRWNLMGAAMFPDYSTSLYRIVRRNLDREVTALVVRARSLDAVSGEVESRTATGKKLRLERLDGGRFRVEALVGSENPPPGTKPGLPLSFLGSRRD